MSYVDLLMRPSIRCENIVIDGIPNISSKEMVSKGPTEWKTYISSKNDTTEAKDPYRRHGLVGVIAKSRCYAFISLSNVGLTLV